MHLVFDENGYVCCILYGCMTDSCVEYSGLVPNEPEEYEDMDDWADRAQTQAYYLNDQGNLTYDADKAASLPAEDEITPYTQEQLDALGITAAIQAGVDSILETIFPVGAVYVSKNDTNPKALVGNMWILDEEYPLGQDYNVWWRTS